jgi:hypothetical protein
MIKLVKGVGKMKYGNRIKIKKVYRAFRHGQEKIWKQSDFKREDCIFLGYRTIKNGSICYDSEYGNYFVPSEYIRVMLVSINAKENPIYVPLEQEVEDGPSR